jgi:hypothetical protein
LLVEESEKSAELVPPLDLNGFEELIREIERLYQLGAQFSDAVANRNCAYLIFQVMIPCSNHRPQYETVSTKSGIEVLHGSTALG